MTRGRVLLLPALALSVLAAAAPAAAGPNPFDNEYEGRAERDLNTYVGFDVAGTGSTKKVAEVTALLSYGCTNGDSGDAAGRVEGRFEVKNGAFAGTLRGQPDPFRARGGSRIKYRVKGRFLPNGKARGTIDATLSFTPTRGDRVRCYTGGLDWRARRGADVKPPL